MTTVSALTEAATTMTLPELTAALRGELAAEAPRKTAISALLDAIDSREGTPTTLVNVATTHLGALECKSGIVIVIDAEVLEKEWKGRTNAQSSYVADIVGEKADYLSKRHGNYPVEDIPHGKRVRCNNVLEARALADEADKLIKREGWNTTTTVLSLGASYTLALDATRREDGPAIARKAAMCMLAIPVGKNQKTLLSKTAAGTIVIG